MAEMLLTLRRDQLRQLVHSVMEDGLVNERFVQLQYEKPPEGGDPMIINMIIEYDNIRKRMFTEMTNLLETPNGNVNFINVIAFAHFLNGRSQSIGAIGVMYGCSEIVHACEAQDVEGAKKGLLKAKRNYSMLQPKLNEVVKMERIVLDCEDAVQRAAAA